MTTITPEILFLPFLVQGVLMLIDEFYFHWKRRLPKWERWGHPLDTLSLGLCFFYTLVMPFSAQGGFLFLAIFSTLFVTKDEWVHAKQCHSTEHWLHSILFILHPIVLAGLYLAWRNPQWHAYIALCLATLLFFLVYQVFFWNFYARKKDQQ